MSYRDHLPPAPLLVGYDPYWVLSMDHLARFVEHIVNEAFKPKKKEKGPGNPAYDPRMCIKVLVYGYATGCRSSRRLEHACREDLGFLFLTRGQSPSYRTLCNVRVQEREALEEIWFAMHVIAAKLGMGRVGNIVVDSSKFRADVSDESVVRAADYDQAIAELKQILAEAEAADIKEEASEVRPNTELEIVVKADQMRDILRDFRKRKRKKAVQDKKDEATKPKATKPKNAKPKAAKPKTTKPEVAQPEVTQPEVAQPEVAQPEVAQPEVAQPEPAPVEAVAPEADGPPQFTLKKIMRAKVEQAISTLEEAKARGAKQVSLTDPDAVMTGEGRSKRVTKCHVFEVATCGGILELAGRCPTGFDNGRLPVIVNELARRVPGAILTDGTLAANSLEGWKVTADSGYFRGDDVVALAQAGVDVCVPSSNTAKDLKDGLPVGTTASKQRGTVPFERDEESNSYHCPHNNELVYKQTRPLNGQNVMVYRAKKDCTGCPFAKDCLTQKDAKRRTLKIGVDNEAVTAQLQRFEEPGHRQRYVQRAHTVETVFGFIRGTLGINRWTLRGAERVRQEASYLGLAYSIRKLHRHQITIPAQ